MIFTKKEWGEKVKHVVLHLDERTPHIHAICSVEETKIHKYKNQKGEFFKEKTSLNAKRFNKFFLQNYQTRYAEANAKFGLSRGLKGSRAKHQELKEFQKKVKEALDADYSENLSNSFDKFIQKQPKKLLHPNMISVSDAKAFFIHELNKSYKKIKILKTHANSIKKEKVAEFEKLEKNNQRIIKNIKFLEELALSKDENLSSKYIKQIFSLNKELEAKNNENEDLKAKIASLEAKAAPASKTHLSK